MATVNLGRIKPVFRGAYDNSTAYVIDDIVTSGNETFIAIAATQGNATSDASKWTKLAAKGADGTDVAATLANKEISFKTNAGALDGIPIGNAGEFLKVNSGATGYEFGAVSSDFVKLASSSNVDAAYIDFNGHFSSTYKNYKLILNDVEWGNGSQLDQLSLRFSTGSYTVNTANYSHATLMAYTDFNGSVGSGSNFNQGVYNADKMRIGRTTSGTQSANMHSQYEITIFNPLGSGFKSVFATYFGYEGNYYNIYMPGFTGGYWENTAAVTGFRLLTSGGENIIASNIALYGIKK